MLAKRTRPRTCRECRYSLAGLPRQCTCPECGLYDDGEYDYRTSRQRLRDFRRHLFKELRDAWPWFAERYVPSLPNFTRAASILIYSAALCTVGVITADALTDCFGIIKPRPAAPAVGPSLISEMTASVIRWAPLLLAVYALATAWQGIIRHRIHITADAAVEGIPARTLGIGALGAGVALVGLFIWMRYLP